jgi:hypothetical protein
LSNHVLEFLQQRPLFVRQQLGIAYNIEKQNVSDLQVEMRLVDTRSATSSLAKLPDCGNMAVKRRVRTALSKVERLLDRLDPPRLAIFRHANADCGNLKSEPPSSNNQIPTPM